MFANSKELISFFQKNQHPFVRLSNDYAILEINTSAKNILKLQNFHSNQSFIKTFQAVPQNFLDKQETSSSLNCTEISITVNGNTTKWHTISICSMENQASEFLLIIDYSSMPLHYAPVSPQAIEKQKNSLLEDYLDNIVSHLPCHLYWKDLQGVYLGCNKLQAKNLGLDDPAQIIGKTDFDLPWKESAKQIQQNDLQVITKGEIFTTEENGILADGTEVHAISYKVPMRDKHNNIFGILGISLDISERKTIELELLDAKEKAEAANLAKSEFLALISHELRIPLTGILGMARLLATETMPLEQHKQVDDIIYSGEHLQAIINDVLDAAKLEANKMALHLAPLNLRKLIEEMATMLSYVIHEKGLELLIDYPLALPHLVFGDAKAIRQILLNLLNNALKFTSKGYIAVRVHCLEQTETQAILTITVEDTGIGIPANKLDSIFDRFSQVDTSRTRKYGGTGLGLTISMAYAKLMSGTLKVESQENHGASFILTIPFQLQHLNAEFSPWEIYKSSVRILIVDDTPRGQVLEKQIASSLCEVTTGKEALNILLATQNKNSYFDIVIVDQQLNTIDALEFAKNVKQFHHLHQPMLILLAPNGGLETQNKAKEAGFFDYFTKPTHPTELLISLTAAWEKWQERNKPIAAINSLQFTHQPYVLLVEDDLIVQKVHKIMLEKLGCMVECSTTGKQALEKIHTMPYDLVLMDIGLPDISGIEVTRNIFNQQQLNKKMPPIIGLTGYDTLEDREKCLTVGMNDVAIKPVHPEELKNILVRWSNIEFK